MAARAFARLPANFRALCEDLVIRVDEFPSPEVLAHMGLSSPYDLLGLFQGIGLPFRPETGISGLMPNMIWLYRRPILAYWRPGGDSLEAIVTHVLVHEIGHHFGFSDDDMEAIEAGSD
jgi:predicted Zn-dependent protease with MMP-like domain